MFYINDQNEFHLIDASGHLFKCFDTDLFYHLLLNIFLRKHAQTEIPYRIVLGFTAFFTHVFAF